MAQHYVEVLAVSPEGFEVRYQLTGAESLWLDSQTLLKRLAAAGFTPRPAPSTPSVTVRAPRRRRRS